MEGKGRKGPREVRDIKLGLPGGARLLVFVTNIVSSPILETLLLLRDLVDPEVSGIFPLRVVFALCLA